MKRAGLVGVAALSVGLACSEPGRSVVLVDVSAPSLTGIDAVIVHVSQNGHSINHAQGTAPLPLKLGIFLPKTIAGSVDVEACAFRGTDNELIGGTNMPVVVQVAPGTTVGPETIVIQAGASPSVCGGTGMGGQGGGAAGAGGTIGGSGGSGGVAGTGGTTGGTGGSTGGRGGTTGLAGGGGTTGLAGRGGTTGAAGAGGTVSDWRSQSPVGTGMSSTEKNPSVAVASNGRAVVVFERDGQIYASCYNPDPSGPSWSGAVPIGGSQVYQLPVVAVDGAGRFTAVWTQGPASGVPTGAWSATTSTDCTAWTAGPSPLTSANASQATVAVNSDGLAIAAWMETGYPTAKMRPSATADWFGAAALSLGANATLPAVAMGNVGAYAVWQMAGSSGLDTVYFNWAAVGVGGSWQSVTQVPTDTSSRAYAPAIAVNGESVIVTYLHQKLTTVELWARRWYGNAFMPPQMVAMSSSTIDATIPPSVTLDDDGTATVVWAAPSGTLLQVQASRAATAATTWSTTAMETDNQAMIDMGVSQAPMPIVRGDGKGNVFVIWRKRAVNSTRFDLFARRYTPGAMWGGGEMKIDAVDMIGGNVASVFSPVLGINGSGMAVAAWYYGGTNVSPDVYAVVSR